MIVKCDWCGQEIEKYPSIVHKHNFCSVKCKNKWQRKNIPREENSPFWSRENVDCDYCGKKLLKKPSQVRYHKNHFCSVECANAWFREHSERFRSKNSPTWRGGKVGVKCDYCGRTHYMWPSRYKRRQKHNFCSRRCKAEWARENWVGENCPNFKGGYQPYYGSNWLIQRRKVRVRDNYICQICGEKENGYEFDVHHIVPFRNFGLENYGEANHLDNLVTLCHSCHSKLQEAKL